MKNVALLLILMSAFSASKSFAQGALFTSGSPMQGAENNFFNFLFHRIHAIGVDGEIAKMTAAGESSHTYRAGFTVEGALVNALDIENGNAPEYYDLSTDYSGLQFLTYKVQVYPNGAFALKVDGVSLRDMVARDTALPNEAREGILKYIDTVDLLSFKWDNNVSFSNIKSFSFSAVTLKVKKNLFATDRSAISLVAGGSIGGQYQTISLASGEEIIFSNSKVNSKNEVGIALQTQAEAGLEYQVWGDSTSSGLKAGVSASTEHTSGSTFYTKQNSYDGTTPPQVGLQSTRTDTYLHAYAEKSFDLTPTQPSVINGPHHTSLTTRVGVNLPAKSLIQRTGASDIQFKDNSQRLINLSVGLKF